MDWLSSERTERDLVTLSILLQFSGCLTPAVMICPIEREPQVQCRGLSPGLSPLVVLWCQVGHEPERACLMKDGWGGERSERETEGERAGKEWR